MQWHVLPIAPLILKSRIFWLPDSIIDHLHRVFDRLKQNFRSLLEQVVSPPTLDEYDQKDDQRCEYEWRCDNEADLCGRETGVRDAG